MPKQNEPYRVYRALLHLYPKAHRAEYGEQMVQTLDDILSDHRDAQGRIAIWFRVSLEMPLNIIEEHVNNLEEIRMDKLAKKFNGRLIGIMSAVVFAVAGVGLYTVLHQQHDFSGITLAQAQRPTGRPACLQAKTNPNLKASQQDQQFIANANTASIIDVPAGTNVDSYLKTYNGSSATGTSVYSGKYGRYNFVAKKVADNATNNYVGGWRITHFEACK